MRRELGMRYLEAIYERYHKASKGSKGRILDEFCKVCGYNRKYATWKLNRMPQRREMDKRKRSCRRRYDHQVLAIVEQVWMRANYPWSLRLKEILRLWLPWMRGRYLITPQMQERLLSISPSTIDRHLRSKKRRLKRRLYGRTKPGTLLRHKIPVRTEHWDVRGPGFVEVDLVSHCGSSARGEFINSLNLTDTFSGWVETQAVMGKGEAGIIEALGMMARRVPFTIWGIDSDNGSEFINHHLWRYCEARGIQFTRSRPYKKDDNAHIEQKNWTHVRKFMGWDRYDSPKALGAINDLYENEFPLFMNLFQPSVKLQKVIRKGARRTRIYDKPQTPLDRLLASKHLGQDKSDELKALRESLDPFSLAEAINSKLEGIWDLAHYRYQSSEAFEKSSAKEGELSAVDRQALEAISHIFGMNIYVRANKKRELVAIRDG